MTAKLPSSTDGNPLFVRELIRMLVDDGVIAQRDDRWELAVDLDAVEVPPTIQSLLATRVERLPPVERRVLEQASVIGPEFPLGALAELVPEIGRSELEAVIERLRRKEQVEPTGTYWGDEPIVRFHHVLIRDAAYRRLLKGARAELHLQVGDWMDRTASGLVGEFEVAIAYHFEQALLYRRQLGDDDATTAEAGRRAAELLHVAADRALERDDLAAAAGLSRRAIDCHADDAESLSELLVLACESVLASGDATTGGALVKRLSERAVGRRPAGGVGDVLRGAARGDDRSDRPAAGDGTDPGSRRPVRGTRRSGRAGEGADRAGGRARPARPGRRVRDRARPRTHGGTIRGRPAAHHRSPELRAGRRAVGAEPGRPGRWAMPRRRPALEDHGGLAGSGGHVVAVPGGARSDARPLRHRRGRCSTRRGPRASNSASNTVCSRRACTRGSSSCSPTIPRQQSRTCAMRSVGSASSGSAPTPARPPRIWPGRCCCRDVSTKPTTSPPTAMRSPARTCRPRSLLVPPRRRSSPPAARPTPALALADEAVRLATDTDLVFDHANALSTLARVRAAAGDADGAQRAASAARDLFAQKGATVAVEVRRSEFGADRATH